jgi:radical SAM superfamily enzyme YgiQ (UPF0313 family)
MRVALIVPALNYPNLECMTVLHFPNGLACLAAALKRAGHTVIGLNPNNDFSYPSATEMVYAKLKHMIETARPQVIGLTGLCTDYHFLKIAIGIIRSLTPGVPVVLGGGIITHDAEFIFRQLKPDFGVMGEGEEVLCQLVHFLETEDKSFASIPNIWFWKNGNACFSRLDYNYPDITTRAFPDYEPFDLKTIMEEYTLAQFYPIRYKRPYPKVMPIVMARSCPFNCTFCVHTRGPKYRARPMESILEEIRINYEKYQFNILFIVDELFAVNRKRLTDFCKGIKEGREKYGWDFDWVFNTHASAAFGREELQLAKDAGCSFFSYGVESASPKVLASMNKKIKPAEIAQALAFAEEVGIGFGGNFILGDIAETSETIMESIQFFAQHCMDFFVSLIYVCAYPGSKLFEYCLDNRILPDRLTYYEYNIQTKMSSMSNEAWMKWQMFIAFIYLGQANDLPFLKTVDAITYYPEQKKIEIQPGKTKTIWKLYFTCPHCDKAIFCRELLYEDDVVQMKAAFVTACPECSKRFNVHLRAHIGIYLPPQERKMPAGVLLEYAHTGIYLPPQERKMPADVLLEYAHKIKQLIEAS